MSTRIILVGGSSGGHSFPLVPIALELQKQALAKGVRLELILAGTGSDFLKNAAVELQLPYLRIFAGKLRRYFSVHNALDFLKMPFSVVQSLYYLWLYMPDLIFSKGGYDSIPPLIAARLLFIPVVVHESDSVPGLANKIASRFAVKIFTSFDGATRYFPADRTELVGNPIRQELTGGSKEEALALFRLKGDRPTILFFGGSQGARVINEAVLLSLVQLTQKYHVVHQCGTINFAQIKAQAESMIVEGEGSYGKNLEENYRLYPFFKQKDMNLAYAAADIIVSRAGAGSIFEIAALGKPAIMVPLKGSASDHQLANATEFAKYGAVIVEEDNLTTNILMAEIENVLIRKDQMSEQIRSFARPDAARIIAEGLLKLI
ncbi:MAG: UDP-N-acetylglucosamine--N-acetylmuramyl-(pentapeptide) pyrophosphoryl-undecaprenol N-acetylglucosamine transferase [bacterium]|nr:UDP-N-acetylglucosamine--N-acetylmuramyl-(pentapeptide) pyrophosphoryl-undecaprenol N-acetylglucosamine transferase [bacterium]